MSAYKTLWRLPKDRVMVYVGVQLTRRWVNVGDATRSSTPGLALMGASVLESSRILPGRVLVSA